MDIENNHRKTPSTQIALRCFQSGDEVALNELFNTTFATSRELKSWQWKFRGYNQPSLPLIVLAFVGDRLVGAYSAIKLEMAVNGKMTSVYQAVDTAVAKEYRGQGLRGQMFRCFIKELNRRGAKLLYGFPNPTLLKSAERQGDYYDLGSFRVFRRPLAADNGGSRRQESIEAREIDSYYPYSSHCEQLAEQIGTSSRFAVFRSAEYLEHRYSDNPDRSFKRFLLFANDRAEAHLVYSIVQAQGRKRAEVYELYGVDSESVAERAVAALIALAKSDSLAEIVCYLRGQKSFEEALLKAGFTCAEDERMRAAIAFPNPELVTVEGALERESWYLSYGDTDL